MTDYRAGDFNFTITYDGERTRFIERLLADLESAGVETIELTPALLEAGGHGNDALWAPGGHYSPAGNRVCADALDAALGS